MTERKSLRTPPADLTSAREVKALVKDSGMTQRDVAAYLSRRLQENIEHYHVSRMMSGNRKVSSSEMDALRELATAKPGFPTENVVALEPTTDSVPLFGYANAAGTVLRLNEDQRVGVVPIHPAQKGSRGAFAVVIFGDSLAERLNHGDTAYVVRNMLPLRDKPVLLEMKTGEAIVKIFMGMDEHTVFCRQLNPKKDVTYPLREVQAMHRVVGSTF